MIGGSPDFNSDKVIEVDDGKTFFYQFWYQEALARFEDPPVTARPKGVPRYRFCDCCIRLDEKHLVRSLVNIKCDNEHLCGTLVTSDTMRNIDLEHWLIQT